jgi:hypothetical protein
MSYHIEIRETLPFKAEEAFERLADHNGLGRILLIPVKRVREGEDETNGVGSVRRMGLWPLDFEETVTAFERPSRIDYRITRGTPLRAHQGSLRFTPKGKKTEVVWTIRYDVPVPVLGSVVREVLSRGIRRGLRSLA